MYLSPSLRRYLKLLFYLPFITVSIHAHSQELTIKTVSLKGDDVIIAYDLNDDDLEHKYTLNLYNSTDNFVQPLKLVEGDIGVDLSVGGNKQVVWHAKEELGEGFKGDVAIEIKGKLYIPFVTLNNFGDISSMKRGRPYNVTWAAGRGSSVLTFDLFNKNEEIVHTYTNIANVGEYKMEIPKDIKPSKNYRVRITDQRNKEDIVYTPYFSVKRKVPLYLTVPLIGLAGSSSLYVINNGRDSPSEQAALLPDPILPFQ